MALRNSSGGMHRPPTRKKQHLGTEFKINQKGQCPTPAGTCNQCPQFLSPTAPILRYLLYSWMATTTLSQRGCRSGKATSSFSWACSRATRGSSEASAARDACRTRQPPGGNEAPPGDSAGVQGLSVSWVCDQVEKPVTKGRTGSLELTKVLSFLIRALSLSSTTQETQIPKTRKARRVC